MSRVATSFSSSPAQDSRNRAKRDMALRWEQAWGGFWALHLLESGHWNRGAERAVTKVGARKDLSWKKERLCCRHFCEMLLLPKLLPESVQQRKLTADSSSCGGGRSERGGIITLRAEGMVFPACFGISESLTTHLPLPLQLRT